MSIIDDFFRGIAAVIKAIIPETVTQNIIEAFQMEFETELGRLNALMSGLLVLVMIFSHLHIEANLQEGFRYKHSTSIIYLVVLVLFLFASLVVVAYSE